MRYIGKPILRVEDDVILRGRAQYVDDIEPPSVLYAGFVRSPYAHARVVKVDLSDVRGAKGVVAVFGPELGFAPGGKVRYQGEGRGNGGGKRQISALRRVGEGGGGVRAASRRVGHI